MTTRLRLPRLPDRPRDGHKGTFGRVLIVGGSPAMSGAPVLSGMAALRAGSGLVQLAVADLMHAASIAVCPELIGLPQADKLSALIAAARKADAIAVGPGWGEASENRRRLMALLAIDAASIVIDADALNVLSRERIWPTTAARLVLTPHPGEMRRLAERFDLGPFNAADNASRAAIATRLARLCRGVVLLKGNRTVIVDGTTERPRVALNTTGDSSLAKAGTGDVLTGLIASLIGQGMGGFDAARLGAHIHGRAGELAGEKLGQRSVLARDVIDHLGAALRERE